MDGNRASCPSDGPTFIRYSDCPYEHFLQPLQDFPAILDALFASSGAFPLKLIPAPHLREADLIPHMVGEAFRRQESNLRILGYEPSEMPLLHVGSVVPCRLSIRVTTAPVHYLDTCGKFWFAFFPKSFVIKLHPQVHSTIYNSACQAIF